MSRKNDKKINVQPPIVNRNDHQPINIQSKSKVPINIQSNSKITKNPTNNQDNTNRQYMMNTSFVRPVSPQSQIPGAMFNPHPTYRPHTPQNRTFSSMAQTQFIERPTVNLFPSTPIPIPDSYCKYSLHSFVTSFEDQTDFNETDLSKLGINLDTEQPILPNLHSVFSDAPLLFATNIPNSYKDCIPPAVEMSYFDKETLFLIFYTQPQYQNSVANELTNKFHFTWDEEHSVWKTSNDTIWDVSSWKEIPNPNESTE